MKIFKYIFVLTAITIGLSGCQSSSDWDDAPTAITEFVSRYFPEQTISSYGETGSGYHVKLNGGTAVSFNEAYNWQTVNGYGSQLPEMFLFDQLPPALYEYIQQLGETGGVYAVHRDVSTYSVSQLDMTVIYDIRNGTIHTILS